MAIPWVVKLPWLAVRFVAFGLLHVARIAGRFLLHGPGYFCWQFGCWNPAWDGCHATPAVGNGRMCRECCGRTGYHSKWRTNCDKPPTALDRYLHPELYQERDMGHAVRVTHLRALPTPTAEA
jgi:hypothetical protein